MNELKKLLTALWERGLHIRVYAIGNRYTFPAELHCHAMKYTRAVHSKEQALTEARELYAEWIEMKEANL